MAKRRLNTSGVGEAREIDDLTIINGIGPSVENRLHGVGIFTFVRLAALSPADIAASVSDLAGLSADRIIKQDWIGQARELALKKTSVESPEVKSEPVIAGPVPSITLSMEPTSPIAAQPELVGNLRLREMEAVSVGAHVPQRILRSGQPFELRLTLDLTGVEVPSDVMLDYAAFIYGKSPNRRRYQTMGEGHGTIIPTEEVIVTVEGTTPPQGMYRLEATVTLNLASVKLAPSSNLMALKEGPLLQVY